MVSQETGVAADIGGPPVGEARFGDVFCKHQL